MSAPPSPCVGGGSRKRTVLALCAPGGSRKRTVLALCTPGGSRLCAVPAPSGGSLSHTWFLALLLALGALSCTLPEHAEHGGTPGEVAASPDADAPAPDGMDAPAADAPAPVGMDAPDADAPAPDGMDAPDAAEAAQQAPDTQDAPPPDSRAPDPAATAAHLTLLIGVEGTRVLDGDDAATLEPVHVIAVRTVREGTRMALAWERRVEADTLGAPELRWRDPVAGQWSEWEPVEVTWQEEIASVARADFARPASRFELRGFPALHRLQVELLAVPGEGDSPREEPAPPSSGAVAP